MRTLLKTFALLSSAALCSLSTLSAVTTDPVGYVTWTIEEGTGNARNISPLGIPLYMPSDNVTGISRGVITGVSSDNITVAGAGWLAGELSSEAAPYIIRITSGLASGRNLLVSTDASEANTTDTLTIDLVASDVDVLTSLDINVGVDTFELVECDTLLSMLGTPSDGAIIGGSDFDSADNIWLLDYSGSWKKFYYDTDVDSWVRNIRGFPAANNEPLLPDNGLLVLRQATQTTELILTGTVPSLGRQMTINKAGLTVLANSFPVDMQLSDVGLESIPDWESSSDADLADIVFVRDGNSWKRFFHNGSEWVENVRGFPNSDDFMIAIGSAIIVQKKTATSSDVTYTQVLPYTL
ncbi:hypothetical protein QEH59_08345 [Coraliomargarita sp. SDUM461004]|uniref:Uncharacterized protein n=1 Tax=Thalassobacterium sedimentorum TaxID=3041258 RepID=A0ABU1AJU1_9BACT|nr:hypothetical protein [Coraliomargarita sp. SDUM461004]MDQ8194433.1 hypothetical protein [Coraliomargarita sp. SDUM461004]